MLENQPSNSTATGQRKQNTLQSNKQSNKRRNMIIALLILALAVVYFWQSSSVQEVVDKPLIVSVQRGDIINTIAAIGSLQPSNLVDVGAQVSGQLQKLYVEVGDLVTEGQLLAEIDARVQENRVEASRASIEAQEAQLVARKASLRLAESNTERQQRLMAANATSQLDYDNALNNLASSKASLIQLEKQIIQSRASLSSDETQLDYTRIYAPAAGTVVSIVMNEGSTLNANQQAPTILRIADLSIMTVQTQISEADIGNVKKGLDVYFTTLGGGERRWYSVLRQILPTPLIENNVVLYTGLFDIENSDSALYSDMTAQVYFITSAAQNVISVPIAALQFIDESNVPSPRSGAVADAAPSIIPSGNAPTKGRRGEAREGGRRARGEVENSQDNLSRPATVQILSGEDGEMQTRQVMVGISNRVSAEITSGLTVGDQVVAGVQQSDVSADSSDENQFRGPPGGFGGFR